MGKVKNIFKVVIVVLSAVLMVGVVSVLFKPKETVPTECTHENVKVLEGYAQTCEKNGLTEGKQCEDCEAILVSQEVIPASGHSSGYESKEAVEPTCYSLGSTAEISCETCKEVLIESKSLGFSAHREESIVDVLETASTCTVPGHEAGRYCVDCKTYVTGGEEKALAEHNYTEWVPETDPTCTEQGLEKRVCLNCPAVDTQAVPANGHALTEVAAVDATCTKSGNTAGVQCKNCEWTTVEITDPLGHTYPDGWTVVKESTCTDYGEMERVCMRCDNVDAEWVLALGHNFVNGVCTRCDVAMVLDCLNITYFKNSNDSTGTSLPMAIANATDTTGNMKLFARISVRNESYIKINQDTQSYGVIIATAEQIAAINGDENTDWAKELKLDESNATFLSGSYWGSGIGNGTDGMEFVFFQCGSNKLFEVTIENLHTKYVAIPVLCTYTDGEYKYQYPVDVSKRYEGVAYTPYEVLIAEIENIKNVYDYTDEMILEDYPALIRWKQEAEANN